MLPVTLFIPLAISLPTVAAPAMGLLALAAVPVVIVYFLKLRRPRQTVPSLVLWQRVMEDQRVNSPFQKFRRNLLLWLQLALLACLVLACMQPLLAGGAGSGQPLPILVDCSASMSAQDEDGVTRMERVREQLRDEIDALPRGRELSIVAAGPRAVRLCDFTDNPSILNAAIDRLRSYAAPNNLDEALRLAEGMTTARQIDRVRLYSDGNLPAAEDTPDVAVVPFDLPFEVDFRRIGTAQPNLGIVEASAQRSGSGEWDVFLRVAAGSEAGRADLVIKQDDRELAPEAIVLEPFQSRRISFSVEATGPTSIIASLKPKQRDALPLDDRVRIDLPTSRKLRVRCDSSLDAFRFALSAFDTIDLVETGADLAFVTDEEDLRDEPAGVIVGSPPAAIAELIRTAGESKRVIDWQRSDALLQHVKLGGVLLGDAPTYRTGKGRKDIEEAGYRVVAEVDGGPLIVRRQDGRNVRYALLFEPQRSTLTYRVGFPVMIANAVDVGFAQAELSAVRGQRAGVMPPIIVDAPGSYEVTGPDYAETFEVGGERVIRGVVADQLGDYEVRRDGASVRSFGVSLLDPVETKLTGVRELLFSEVTVEASERPPSVERPLWRWLTFAALALLAVEWWYFHRPVTAARR